MPSSCTYPSPRPHAPSTPFQSGCRCISERKSRQIIHKRNTNTRTKKLTDKGVERNATSNPFQPQHGKQHKPEPSKLNREGAMYVKSFTGCATHLNDGDSGFEAGGELV